MFIDAIWSDIYKQYACRKTLADRRVRVRGRFAKNNELSEEEMMIMMKKEDDNSPNDKNLYYCDALQVLVINFPLYIYILYHCFI